MKSRRRHFNRLKQNQKSKADWWSRADIISKILSSLLIATFGIALTWYIQRTQISTSQSIAQSQLDAQKIKSDNDKKLEEGRITAQLLQHLASDDPVQRELAIVTLRESVPAEIYYSVVEVLARTDPNENVRKAAIEQLGRTNNPNVAGVLTNISADKKRTPSERKAARQSTQRAVIGSVLANDTYAFAASANAAIDKGSNGLFTYHLLRGLDGNADTNNDNLIAANELQNYLSSQLAAEFQRRDNRYSTSAGLTRGSDITNVSNETSLPSNRYMPVTAFEGSGDVPVWGENAGYGRIVALIIGVGRHSDKEIMSLPSTNNDIRMFNEVLKKDKRAITQMLVDPKKYEILDAMNQLKKELKPDDLFILYFSGHGVLGKDGSPKWVAYDSNLNSDPTLISLSSIKNFLDEIQVKTKTLYIDTCFSRVDEIFTGR